MSLCPHQSYFVALVGELRSTQHFSERDLLLFDNIAQMAAKRADYRRSFIFCDDIPVSEAKCNTARRSRGLIFTGLSFSFLVLRSCLRFKGS